MEFISQNFGRFSHVQPADRIGQAELDCRDGPEVPRAELKQDAQPAPPTFGTAKLEELGHRFPAVQQRNLAHRLDATSQHDRCFAELDELGCRRDRFHSGGAIAMDGMGNPSLGYTGPQCYDPGNIGRIRWNGGVAEDDLVNLFGSDSRTLKDRPCGHDAQLHGVNGHERTEGLGKGRTNSFNNGNVKHGSHRAPSPSHSALLLWRSVRAAAVRTVAQTAALDFTEEILGQLRDNLDVAWPFLFAEIFLAVEIEERRVG